MTSSRQHWAARPGTQRGRVLAWLYQHPWSTTQQIAHALGLARKTCTSVLHDAMAAGAVEVRHRVAVPAQYRALQAPATTVPEPDSVQALLRAVAGPDGATLQPLLVATGLSEIRLRHHLATLRRQGRLVIAREGRYLRWFASAQQAIAWQHRQQRPAQPAGVRIAPPRPRVGDALMTERTRVTVCPSIDHDPRYQLPPGSRPYGAGFAAVGIGRNVDTGRAWS